ncbi:unnamed protein product [Durusdinium trenchii]|uniref:Pentatricopeptide repeat-containing protein, chloroplastic n=1 Tax=Durusdinium trenchii TaxID=1381693 RepID=A0ABP0NFM5_9DINO
MGKVTKASLRDQPWDVILQVLQDAQVPSVALLGAAVDALGRQRRWQTVVELLHCMEEATLQANIVLLNAALNSVKAGGWLVALSLKMSMDLRGSQPDVITWNTLANGCMKSSGWEVATRCLTALQRPNLEPSVASFGAVSAGGPWRRSVALSDVMLHSGLHANRISNNAVLGVCASFGQWTLCLDQLGHLKHMTQPDVLSFSAVSSASEKGHQWLPALRVLHQSIIEAIPQDAALRSTVLSSCEKCHRVLHSSAAGGWHCRCSTQAARSTFTWTSLTSTQ